MILDKLIYAKMKLPLEEIKEDFLVRKEVFADESWYNDFILYLSIGVCQPKEENITDVRKALKIFGHETSIRQSNGIAFVIPYVREHTNKKQREER